MTQRFPWLLVAVAFTIAAVLARTQDTPHGLLLAVILLPWCVAVVRMPYLDDTLRALWRVPAVPIVLLLLGFALLLLGWLVAFQPAAGIAVQPMEIVYLLAGGYALVFGFGTGADSPQRGKPGWLAGPLVTLATALLIVFAVELALRYLWVRSDNFQFSKMHQNWARLYWQPLNELNYRDDPIPPQDDPRQHVIVAGDSLAAGYGVNDIDDTFPHLLDEMLGEDYTVNLVAQPGWGISTALALLDEYPLTPDVLILSHYTNDIAEGPAGDQYGQPFPQIRLEPDAGLIAWLVDNFYIANFLYYRVFLYMQHDAVRLYNEWIESAYNDPAVWAAYEDEMQAVIDWAAQREVRLVVLVWPNLLDIDGTQQYTQPVRDYFSAQGISVVDMGAALADDDPRRLIVNPFDAHPSAYSHQQAARALYDVLRER